MGREACVVIGDVSAILPARRRLYARLASRGAPGLRHREVRKLNGQAASARLARVAPAFASTLASEPVYALATAMIDSRPVSPAPCLPSSMR
jgi:hypothetical protein